MVILVDKTGKLYYNIGTMKNEKETKTNTEVAMKQTKKVIVSLTGALADTTAFCGVKLDTDTEKDYKYTVYNGGCNNSYTTLGGAVRSLKKQFPYENTGKYNKVDDVVYERISDPNWKEEVRNTDNDKDLAREICAMMAGCN
jgi:hypothetical protein